MTSDRDATRDDAAILSVLGQARDLSAQSDELAAHAVGPLFRRHFSRLRANLIAPLDVRPDMRVLEVGCASSAITRALGESDANVIGLATTPSRAHLVRARCRELDNVEVRVGVLADLERDTSFDLVVMVDALDGIDSDDGNTAESVLADVRRILAPGGRIALAMTNPLALRTLLGYAEDADGVPWSTIDDRRSNRDGRFTRRQVAAMLSDAGLPSQHWYLPFPDHYEPRVILHERLLDDEHADLLVPHFLRGAVDGERHLVCDDVAAVRAFQDGGLLADLANAFLVVACAEPGDIDDRPLAWDFGPDRAGRWQALRTLRRDASYTLECTSPRSQVADWLAQDIRVTEPFPLGENLEDLVRDAIVRGDVMRTHDLVQAWANEVAQAASVAPAPNLDSPFAPTSSTSATIDGAALECDLDRYVVTTGGDLCAVGHEWRNVGPVDADLVRLRALTLFVEGLLEAGIRIPWVDGAHSPLHVVELFAAEAGVHAEPEWQERLAEAEKALQTILAGCDADSDVERRLERLRRPWLDASGVPPFTATIRDLTVAKRSLASQDKELRALRHEVGELQDRLAPIEILAAVQERALQDILTSPTWKLAEAAKAPLRRLRVLTDPRQRGKITIDIDQSNLPPAEPVPMDEISVVRSSNRGMAGANVAIIAGYDLRNRYGAAVEHMVSAFAAAGWRTIVSYSTAVDPTSLTDDRAMPDVLISRDHRGAGYDFFSWRVALEVCTDLWAASRVVMVNDSVIGPISPLEGLLSRLETSHADVLGFAESADPYPHVQSWGIAFSGEVITDRAMSDFYCQAGLDWPKESIIPRLEVPLGMWFARKGYAVEAICSPITLGGEVRNPSIFGWEGLIRAGVPFVKRELFTKPEETLNRKPHDILIAARHLATIDIDPLVRDSIASVAAPDRLDG